MKGSSDQHFDVVICGGGLAGLTLALQLKLSNKDLQICVLEKQKRPIPVAIHKVGESSVEGGAYYLMKCLKLESYVQEEHIEKLGLRFFGSRQNSFADRFERGIPDFEPGIQSFQFDRGLLETYLRQVVIEKGIRLEEGVRVDDIVIAAKGLNEVHFVDTESHKHCYKSTWLVDALGRRQLLQRKLKLQKPSPHKASASWWRLKGECDVSAIVPSSDIMWHQRVNVKRWYSTNHLVGKGYWIWFIPLGSGNTSIGIVSDETLHPIGERHHYAAAVEWLKIHEPEVAALISGFEHLDYRIIKGFAHLSHQVFSENGWACVGEAGVFSDPLYSIGLDLIAMANTSTCTMIKWQMAGKLNSKTCRFYNEVFLNTVEMVTEFYEGMYPMFGNDEVFLSKLTWDYMMYWGYIAPLIIHDVFSYPAAVDKLSEIGRHIRQINYDCQLLFRKWAEGIPPNCLSRGLYTKSSSPIQEPMRLALAVPKTADEYLEEAKSNLSKMARHVGVLYNRAADQVQFDADTQGYFRKYYTKKESASIESKHDDELTAYLNEYFVPAMR